MTSSFGNFRLNEFNPNDLGDPIDVEAQLEEDEQITSDTEEYSIAKDIKFDLPAPGRWKKSDINLDKPYELSLEDIKMPDSLKKLSLDDTEEEDERHRWFFRVKIGGKGGAKQAESVLDANTKSGLKQEKEDGEDEEKDDESEEKDLEEDLGTTNKDSDSTKKEENPQFEGFELMEVPSHFKKLSEIESATLPDNTKVDYKEGKFADIKLEAFQFGTKEALPGYGELLFDSTKGDILGEPWIRLSTYEHARAVFIINDPTGAIFKQLSKHSEVQIECGFINGFKVNKFIGKIYAVERIFPDGTRVDAVDGSFSASTAPNLTEKGQSTGSAKVEDDSGAEITSTFEGEASFYGGGDGFDGGQTANGEIFDASQMTAAHKELPFDTKVRVTNTSNGKSVIVRINDRGPYAGDRIIDLSAAAAEALGFKDSGVAKVKCEVLGEGTEDSTTPTPSPTPTPTATPSPSPTPTATPTKTQPLTPSATAEEEKKNVAEVQEKNDVVLSETSSEVSLGISKLASSFDQYNPLFQTSGLEARQRLKDLKVADKSLMRIPELGEAWLNETAEHMAQIEAMLRGETIVTRGNTTTKTAPGQGESSGVILDFQKNRAAFIKAIARKNAGLRLQSGYGAITVKGWNANDKTVVSGTAVSTDSPLQHPTGVIDVPNYKSLNLSDPIVKGGLYTWGDATRDGERPPESQDVVIQMAEIAQILEQISKKYYGGKKIYVTSWYRDPATNASTEGASTTSFHMSGGAVDFRFTFESTLNLGEMDLYDEFNNSHPGGVAYKLNCFIHLDTGKRSQSDTPQRARWPYGGSC
jgi:rare lipoprotein A